ncbi:MAG: hypothetical protein VBE63_02175 [Lamprobacter sp.]|uniref:hypothetical protein n=1 Tax=Lamprobacter sp. TaxID=3100796 RepID=UPI002B257958|nr:hypothetical protein [Lamprobacter sp.]MEA3638733.1 hypothetical protein [Lamprobacter sp.]
MTTLTTSGPLTVVQLRDLLAHVPAHYVILAAGANVAQVVQGPSTVTLDSEPVDTATGDRVLFLREGC